ALVEAGAEPGCPVTIGDVTFDWEPSTPAGAAVMMAGRGSDPRLERSGRTTAAQRKAARAERRRHRTDEELWPEGRENENEYEDWDAWAWRVRGSPRRGGWSSRSAPPR